MPPPIRGLISCNIYIDLDQRAFARSWLSRPILFTAAGLIAGPLGLTSYASTSPAPSSRCCRKPRSQWSFSLTRLMLISAPFAAPLLCAREVPLDEARERAGFGAGPSSGRKERP